MAATLSENSNLEPMYLQNRPGAVSWFHDIRSEFIDLSQLDACVKASPSSQYSNTEFEHARSQE